jgi:hypothetical protein
MMMVELADVEEIIAHYWGEYPKPKEVRDVLEDILQDIKNIAFEGDEP